MATKYPKWFNASYMPGYKPTPPSETIWEYKPVHTITAHDYDYTDLTELPGGTNCITVHVDRDYYDDSIYGVQIIFAHKKQIPNPQFKKQKKTYEDQLEAYNTQVKEWKDWKKIWDAEQEVKDKERRRKEYNKLKKEFDGKKFDKLKKEFESE